MQSLCRIAEVFAYSILSLLPFLVLALYPFKEHQRFSLRITRLLAVIVTLIHFWFSSWNAFVSDGQAAIISAVSTVLYAGFFMLAVKIHLGKILFTLLMLSNIANLTVIASKSIEGQLFPALAMQPYRWSFLLILFFVELVLLVPLFFYFRRTYTPAIQKESSGIAWRYLWLVPATFYLLWYYAIYGNIAKTSLEISMRPSNAVFFFFINLGAFLIYFVVAKLLIEQEKNLRLEESNHQLAMQKLQYDNLHNKIAEARQAKHDVRHHITLMQEYLKNQEFDALEKYLSQYKKRIPDDCLVTFCRNPAVNSILLYFAQQAKDNRIDYIVKMDIPEVIHIEENDLSVLLGNLLENALDACLAEKRDNTTITVFGKSDEASVYLTIDNTFTGTLRTDQSGHYLSTKHNGAALGIKSVRNIVNEYGGVFRLATENGKFCASVLLNYKD